MVVYLLPSPATILRQVVRACLPVSPPLDIPRRIRELGPTTAVLYRQYAVKAKIALDLTEQVHEKPSGIALVRARPVRILIGLIPASPISVLNGVTWTKQSLASTFWHSHVSQVTGFSSPIMNLMIWKMLLYRMGMLVWLGTSSVANR